MQKEFQHGLHRHILACVGLTLCLTAFCYWQGGIVRDGHEYMDPQLFAETAVNEKPPAVAALHKTQSINRSMRESDLYLVASHNLAEGTELTAADLRVVEMPGLHGYELAFFNPRAVIGMFTAHAVPEGQPVLPYHVSVGSKRGRGFVKIQ